MFSQLFSYHKVISISFPPNISPIRKIYMIHFMYWCIAPHHGHQHCAMDTNFFKFMNDVGIEYEIRNCCGRNIGTDFNSNFPQAKIQMGSNLYHLVHMLSMCHLDQVTFLVVGEER